MADTSETVPLTGDDKPTYDTEKCEETPKRDDWNFIARLKEARRESDGPIDFMGKFFLILLSTIGFIIFAGILLAVPIAMIVVGALNLDDCPVEHYIPIWLIVSGCVVAFLQIVYIIKASIDIHLFKDKSSPVSKLYSLFNTLLILFSLGWFIAGNVWVFSHYPPNVDEPSNAEFCEAGVYYFSFALIIVAYAWLLFTACCSGCVAVAGIKDVADHVSKTVTGAKEEQSTSKE